MPSIAAHDAETIDHLRDEVQRLRAAVGVRDQLIDGIARTARLYQRGLITAQELTNVTLNDLHRFDDQRCRMRHDGSGRCIREMGHPGSCQFQPQPT